MRRFFQKNIDINNLMITDNEAKHISRVLRMKQGDMLVLFDGSGSEYLCIITEIHEGKVLLEHKETQFKQKDDLNITLYQGLIKSDHVDYVVQKCSECNVFKIVFYSSEHCVKKLDDKGVEKLLNRQRKIAEQSAKQCKRSTIANVDGVFDLQSITFNHEITLFAYEDEKNTSIKSAISGCKYNDIGIIIGTEGGFSTKEAKYLIAKGAKSVSLGKNILRSETAGVAAISMINYERMD